MGKEGKQTMRGKEERRRGRDGEDRDGKILSNSILLCCVTEKNPKLTFPKHCLKGEIF